MRRRKRRASIFPPEIKAVIEYLDYLYSSETSPEMKKVIFYLKLQAALTLKIEIPPAIKFLIDLREGKEVSTRTLAQECHWRNPTFQFEFKEIIPCLRELVLSSIKLPIITWYMKTDIDWLYDLGGTAWKSKGEMAESRRRSVLDYMCPLFFGKVISATDRLLAFFYRWPNFYGSKGLDALSGIWMQRVFLLARHEEDLSKLFYNLERYRKGFGQDKMTKVCGNIGKSKLQREDFKVWDFWVKNLNTTQKEAGLKFYHHNSVGTREVKVNKALNRVHKGIYGTKLPKDKKMVKLEWHLQNCEQCEKKNPCPEVLKYQRREIGYQREKRMEDVGKDVSERFDDSCLPCPFCECETLTLSEDRKRWSCSECRPNGGPIREVLKKLEEKGYPPSKLIQKASINN